MIEWPWKWSQSRISLPKRCSSWSLNDLMVVNEDFISISISIFRFKFIIIIRITIITSSYFHRFRIVFTKPGLTFVKIGAKRSQMTIRYRGPKVRDLPSNSKPSRQNSICVTSGCLPVLIVCDRKTFVTFQICLGDGVFLKYSVWVPSIRLEQCAVVQFLILKSDWRRTSRPNWRECMDRGACVAFPIPALFCEANIVLIMKYAIKILIWSFECHISCKAFPFHGWVQNLYTWRRPCRFLVHRKTHQLFDDNSSSAMWFLVIHPFYHAPRQISAEFNDFKEMSELIICPLPWWTAYDMSISIIWRKWNGCGLITTDRQQHQIRSVPHPPKAAVHIYIKSGPCTKFGPPQTNAQNFVQPISQNQIMNC
jgi:hypothetical protein